MGERERLEKEIAKQMGYDDVEEAFEKGDWKKVSPELYQAYVFYCETHIEEELTGNE